MKRLTLMKCYTLTNYSEIEKEKVDVINGMGHFRPNMKGFSN